MKTVMTTSDRTPVRVPFRRLLGAGACLVLACLAGATLPAQARSAPSPSLSISVDNGRSTLAPGDASDYTITLANLGARPVRSLRLSQTVPPGSSVVTTGSGGTVRAGTVRWTLDVPASGQVVLRTTLRVSDPAPPDLLRLATVACAAVSTDAPPLVCATDSDELPAGVTAAQQQAAAPATTGRSWWPYVGGGALLTGAVLGGIVVLRRRRGSRALRSESDGS